MIASRQSRKLAILQLNGGEGSRRWRVPGLKTGTGRDRSSPRLSICQGVLLMKTLEASAATDGVSLNEAAERLVKGGRLALKELKCARATRRLWLVGCPKHACSTARASTTLLSASHLPTCQLAF